MYRISVGPAEIHLQGPFQKYFGPGYIPFQKKSPFKPPVKPFQYKIRTRSFREPELKPFFSENSFDFEKNWSFCKRGKQLAFFLPKKNQTGDQDRTLLIDPQTKTISIGLPKNPRKVAACYHPLAALMFSHLFPLEKAGVVLHAAGIKIGSKGFLFVGPSGAGKSTISNLFHSYFEKKPHSQIILSDERIILDAKGRIYGTPWPGTAGFKNPETAKLKGICFLKKGSKNKIRPKTPLPGFMELFQGLYAPYGDKQLMGFCSDLLSKTVKKTDLFDFQFSKSQNAPKYFERHFLKTQ